MKEARQVRIGQRGNMRENWMVREVSQNKTEAIKESMEAQKLIQH